MFRSKRGKLVKKETFNKYQNVSNVLITRKDDGHNENQDHTYSHTELPDLHMSHEEFVLTSRENHENGFTKGWTIVELEYVAKQLRQCQHCGNQLMLHNFVGQRNFGLGSVLDILCKQCGGVCPIVTNKKHGNVYDVNTKIGTALVHSGIGVSQLNSILACFNLPAVSHSLVNRRLHEAGTAIEEVASEEVEDALLEEAGSEREADFSVDGGWQKRGSGKTYDSLSGHCTMIGCRTGKVVGYAVRSKTCKLRGGERYGSRCKPHDCRKNWSGSAKAMESDMIVEMFQKVEELGIQTRSIVGDEDSATISLVKKRVSKSINKKSDRNHIRKNVSSLLYDIQKKK